MAPYFTINSDDTDDARHSLVTKSGLVPKTRQKPKTLSRNASLFSTLKRKTGQ